jgi:hypothetical protein
MEASKPAVDLNGPIQAPGPAVDPNVPTEEPGILI